MESADDSINECGLEQALMRIVPQIPESEDRAEVVLISMPFNRLIYPSIGLSLLRAALVPLGVRVKILYLGLRFAKLIGADLYDQITELGAHGDLMGEWSFSGALFDPGSLSVDGYINDVLSRYPATFVRQTLSMRYKVDSFLDECCAEVLGYRPAIVGFTSIFQQHVPSLSLAKRIKALAPRTFMVFGGANCEGVMGAETIRQFPFVDAAVSGEGETVFPELIQRVLERKSTHDLVGVYTRKNIAVGCINSQYPNAPRVHEMDALPFPDYDDFFSQYRHQREASSSAGFPAPGILFETSRGCWWGEKYHCTFCGLSEDILVFRSKSCRRALDELEYLVNKYSIRQVFTVDNILDMKYFKDLIPELAARRLSVTLFYEVKANLKKEQLRLMRDAGIVAIQPGIESFSTRILNQMRKGTTGLKSIQVLKWCEELGIEPCWLLLWGFPGEPAEEYRRMTDLIPFLAHLCPPAGGMAIRLERFSPNFEDAEKLGFTDVIPRPAYGYIYPFAAEAVANLAYFFSYRYREAQDVESYTKPVKEKITEWKSAYSKQFLVMTDKRTHVEIIDTRSIAREREVRLSGLQRVLYMACDSICSVSELQKTAEQYCSKDVTSKEVEETLQPLVDRGLMIMENGSYLSLAIDPFAKLPVLQVPKGRVVTSHAS